MLFSVINACASQIIGSIAQLVERRYAYVMIHVCSSFVTSSSLFAATMVFEGRDERSHYSVLRLRELNVRRF